MYISLKTSRYVSASQERDRERDRHASRLASREIRRKKEKEKEKKKEIKEKERDREEERKRGRRGEKNIKRRRKRREAMPYQEDLVKREGRKKLICMRPESEEKRRTTAMDLSLLFSRQLLQTRRKRRRTQRQHTHTGKEIERPEREKHRKIDR